MRCNGGTVWSIYKESVMCRKVQKSPDMRVLPVGIALTCWRCPRQLELTLNWPLLAMNVVSVSEWFDDDYLFLSLGKRRLSPLMLGIRMMACV